MQQHRRFLPVTAHHIQRATIALNEALICYGLALGLALVCALVPSLTSLYMLTPATAVLIVLALRGEWQRTTWHVLGLTRLGLRTWPVALLIPTLVIATGYLLAWGSGVARPVAPLDQIEWWNIVRAGAVVLLINTCVFSLGEELGWRGYFLTRLAGFGPIRADVVIGIAWAAWHYPLILLTDTYYATGNRWLLTLLFTLTVIAISVSIGELRRWSGSVWVASLFHSAHNVTWAIFASLTQPAPHTDYIAGESGLIPLMLYTLVALVCSVWRIRHRGTTPATARPAP